MCLSGLLMASSRIDVAGLDSTVYAADADPSKKEAAILTLPRQRAELVYVRVATSPHCRDPLDSYFGYLDDESNLSRASHQHLDLVCLVFNKTIEPLFDDLIQANAFGNHLSSHVQPTVRQCLDHLLEVTLLVRGNAHVALLAENEITWEEGASFLPDGNVDIIVSHLYALVFGSFFAACYDIVLCGVQYDVRTEIFCKSLPHRRHFRDDNLLATFCPEGLNDSKPDRTATQDQSGI
ncbi:hypothetical protein KC360_g193 [Hortaea werneckii]|nr:hypothetical protein KC360_g193 [Hortaea werneckii]